MAKPLSIDRCLLFVLFAAFTAFGSEFACCVWRMGERNCSSFSSNGYVTCRKQFFFRIIANVVLARSHPLHTSTNCRTYVSECVYVSVYVNYNVIVWIFCMVYIITLLRVVLPNRTGSFWLVPNDCNFILANGNHNRITFVTAFDKQYYYHYIQNYIHWNVMMDFFSNEFLYSSVYVYRA